MNSKPFLSLTLSTLILLAAAPASRANGTTTENPAGTLTLRQALRLAVLQNPELAAAGTEIRAAEGRLLQAGLRPNPSVFSEVDDLTGSGRYRGAGLSETTLQISQLIELGGKRAARVRGGHSMGVT